MNKIEKLDVSGAHKASNLVGATTYDMLTAYNKINELIDRVSLLDELTDAHTEILNESQEPKALEDCKEYLEGKAGKCRNCGTRHQESETEVRSKCGDGDCVAVHGYDCQKNIVLPRPKGMSIDSAMHSLFLWWDSRHADYVDDETLMKEWSEFLYNACMDDARVDIRKQNKCSDIVLDDQSVI